MTPRLQKPVSPAFSWTAISSALLLAIISGAWVRFDAAKLETARYIADSTARTFGDSLFRLDVRRELRDMNKKLEHIDSTLSHLQVRR